MMRYSLLLLSFELRNLSFNMTPLLAFGSLIPSSAEILLSSFIFTLMPPIAMRSFCSVKPSKFDYVTSSGITLAIGSEIKVSKKNTYLIKLSATYDNNDFISLFLAKKF